MHVLRYKDGKNPGKMSIRDHLKLVARSIVVASHQEGKQNFYTLWGDRFRKRPLNEQHQSDLEWRSLKLLRDVDRRRRPLHLRQPDGKESQQWPEGQQWRERHQWQERQDWHGWQEWNEWVQIYLAAKSLYKFLCQSVDVFFFFWKKFAYRHSRMSCTRRRVKTEHLTVRTNAHALAQDELSIRVCIFSKVFLSSRVSSKLAWCPWPSSLSYHASYGIRHNLRRSTGWFTVWPKNWADPISCYEPEDLIDISSEYTPITFPSRKNSFTTDIDDVPTVVASDITETIEAGQLTSPLFTQEREVSANPFGVSVFQPAASGSQQQPNFKTEVCVTTPFPQLSMSWINEVEMARSMKNLMTSQSIEGRRAFPDFEMLDARIASPLRKIIFNTSFIYRVSVEERRAQEQNRFLTGRQIAYMINDHFSSYRSLRCSSRPIRPIQNLPTEWRRSRFRYKTGPNSIRNKWVTSRECPGRFVQYEVAGFRSTSNCVGFVQTRNESR